MLQFFRKGLSSPIALGVLGLVVIAFIITGVGDPFSGGATRVGTIAEVGSRSIIEADLQRSLDNVLVSARQQKPDVTMADLAKDGAVGIISEQLIGKIALEEYAAKLGLVASEPAIGAVIAGIPAFQVAGKFDQATYNRVIGEQRLSDAQLRADIGGDIVRKQLLTPLTASLGVSPGQAAPFAQQIVDVHRGAVAIVPPVQVTPASDAETTTFYNSNRQRFAVPERRAFRFAILERSAIAESVKVTDAAIAQAFAKDPAAYGAASTRRLLQVVVAEEAKAREIAAAAAIDGFAKAAQRLAGFGSADIAIGEKSQSEFARETSPAVAKAAFELSLGGISAPIKSDFGWHVLSLEALGAPARTLAQATPMIREALTRRAVDDALSATVARIEDAVEAGKSFADIATAERLSIFSQPPVTREGASIDQAPLQGLPATLAVRAFTQAPEDGVVVQQLDSEKLALIETTSIVAATTRPLAEIKPLVTALATQNKAVQAARAKADAVVAAVKKGTPFAKAVADAGLAPPQPLAGRRLDAMQQGQQVPPIVQAFLGTPANTTRVLGGAEGWALIHVDSIEPGDLAAAPGIVDAMRREIAGQLTNEFAEAFAAAAQREIKTKRNTAAIDALRRRLGGQSAASQ